MTENEWKLLIAILTLGLLCLVAIGIGVRVVVLDAIDQIVYKASHQQLLLDAESMRNGQCLRPLRGDPSSVNRKLLAALNRV